MSALFDSPPTTIKYSTQAGLVLPNRIDFHHAHTYYYAMGYQQGFTVVELAVAITIIIVLVAISFSIPHYLMMDARDAERVEDTESLARRLEQAYNAQEIGRPAYPPTSTLLSNISTRSGTVSRLSPDSFISPDDTITSVIAATSTSVSQPLGATTVQHSQYVYQPVTAANTLCTASSHVCVKFNLFYMTEKSNTLRYVKSVHQQ